MNTCHRCEEEDSAEYTCPECGEYTCENCFVETTQFNAGNPFPCKSCEGDHEARWRSEADKKHGEEQALAAARKHRSEKAHKRYWTPEAIAKREAAKVARLEAKWERQKRVSEKVSEAMSVFARFF